MNALKKAPPDNIGNLHGRLQALKTGAQNYAGMVAKEGGDYDHALAKETKALKSRFKGLRDRLAKTQKSSTKTKGKSKRQSKDPVGSSGAPKKRSAGTVPADYDDLLETLEDL